MKTLLAFGFLIAVAGAALRFLPEEPEILGHNDAAATTITHASIVKNNNAETKSALGGFVEVWSSRAMADSSPIEPRPAASAPIEINKATSPTPEQVLAQARYHSKVSVRILQLQAEQDPANARIYLTQADQISARSEPVVPPQGNPPTEFQRKLNAAISSRIDEIASTQRSQTYIPSTSVRNVNLPPRAGDTPGPRAGDIATR